MGKQANQKLKTQSFISNRNFHKEQGQELYKKILESSSSTQREQLEKLIQAAYAHLGFEMCVVYKRGEGGSLELVFWKTFNPKVTPIINFQKWEFLLAAIGGEKRPLFLETKEDFLKFHQLPPQDALITSDHKIAVMPILRDQDLLGAVLVKKNSKAYFTNAQKEGLYHLTEAVADIISPQRRGAKSQQSLANQESMTLRGVTIHPGLASGIAVLHEKKFEVAQVLAQDVLLEKERFEKALIAINQDLKSLLGSLGAHPGDDQQSILMAFQMYAKDQGWLGKIRTYIDQGYTAEAAAQEVLNGLRFQMQGSHDFYTKDLLWDFEDLTYRLIRHLKGTKDQEPLIDSRGIILVARTMGPAELLEYHKYDVKALLLEEGAQTAHVSIVARSLNIPIIGCIPGVISHIAAGDWVQVDGYKGSATVCPTPPEVHTFQTLVHKQEKIEQEAKNYLTSLPITLDGIKISLSLNAGLISDLDCLGGVQVEGVGLYRTEIPFMMQHYFPEVTYQAQLYSEALLRAEGRPVIFRTLDIGGDKILPYFRHFPEENPMLGWRAIRIGLDRPMLLRKQVRALIRAAQGKTLYLMFPLVSDVDEFLEGKDIVLKELSREKERGNLLPIEIKYGAMIEVPSILWRLDALLPHTDFISVGTNDLFQFFYAVDRGNPYVAGRYDTISPAFLSALQEIRLKAETYRCPISVCGEMGGTPLEALALLGIGYRHLSMSYRSLGLTKMMIKSLNLKVLTSYLSSLLSLKLKSIRNDLSDFARDNKIKV